MPKIAMGHWAPVQQSRAIEEMLKFVIANFERAGAVPDQFAVQPPGHAS